jgi:hypothetical protein
VGGIKMKKLFDNICFKIFGAAIFAIMFLIIQTNARSQQSPWGNVKVVPAPKDFSYKVQEVYFKRPHTYKNTYSKIEKTLVAVKVIVYGRDFREKATGPVVWLNRIGANIVRVSPDGDILQAYFYKPFNLFKKGFKELRGWELVYLPHDGARAAYIIGPEGRESESMEELKAKPPIRMLTEAEWKHVEELSTQYRVPLPSRRIR